MQETLDEIEKTGEKEFERKEKIFMKEKKKSQSREKFTLKKEEEVKKVTLKSHQITGKGFLEPKDGDSLTLYGYFNERKLKEGMIVKEGQFKYDGEIQSIE